MALYFRPLPRFTAVCVPMLAVLVALGIWQIERLHWKLALIAEMQTHLHAPPMSSDSALAAPADAIQYRRVRLNGQFDNLREAFVYATDPDLGPVYHVVVPFRLDDGRVLLVDRGIVPPALRDARSREPGELAGRQTILGVWRTPDAPGYFTPPPDMAKRIWYARDVSGIARALGVPLAAPVLVEATAAPVPGGWPRGGQTVVALRNDHLQYALTWFLLAASLVVVYFAYHRAQGRLGYRR